MNDTQHPRQEPANTIWLWLVPLLLLISALSLPLIDADSLWFDEVWSIRNAGGAHYGPLSAAGIWQQVTQIEPNQALGYPYLLAVWGNFVGWSELAGRYLSLLAGLLTVALTYRLGRDVHSPTVGFFAALILGLSGFFIYYTHELRAFTLVALAAVLTLWAYYRLLNDRNLHLSTALAFVGGGFGLLYTHYFAAATLLVALGLYHLLLVPKTKRWWQITGLAGIVALLFLPALQAFWLGFTRFNPEDVRQTPLTAPQVIQSLLRYIGNQLPLTGLLLVAGLIAWWRQPQARFIIWVGVFGIVITILANEALGILEPQRVRYVIVLFPLLALWGGGALGWLVQWRTQQRMLLFGIVGIAWVANALLVHNGAWLNPIRAEAVLRWRTMTQVMQTEASPDDLFAYYGGTGREVYGVRLGFEYATGQLPFANLVTSTLYEGETGAWARAQVDAAQRVWYGVDRRNTVNTYHADFEALLAASFVNCGRAIETQEMTLDLYAQRGAFCSTSQVVQQFGERLTLVAMDVEMDNRSGLSVALQLQLAPGLPPDTYNLALHLVAADEQVPVAQRDLPLPDTPTALIDAQFDVNELPSDDYTLYAIVYDWRSGERLGIADGSERLELTTLAP